MAFDWPRALLSSVRHHQPQRPDGLHRAAGRSWSGGGPGGGFAGGGVRNPRVIDEPRLQAVAEITGGQYYKAQSATSSRMHSVTCPASSP